MEFKELIKPPFIGTGGCIEDQNGKVICILNQKVFTSKDGNYIEHMMKLQEFIVFALNKESNKYPFEEA